MKSLVLGLAVAVIAVSTSAFTNYRARAAGDIYVQVGTDTWQRLSDPNDYSPVNCQNISDQECSFEQSASDNTDHGDVLTREQISNIPSLVGSAQMGQYDL
ncbi:MAG: hypothetical protein QHC79_25670 [Pseudosphingobacterium sp.]|nr:hypothetical protein [Pseudosphingobacterium sp.]